MRLLRLSVVVGAAILLAGAGTIDKGDYYFLDPAFAMKDGAKAILAELGFAPAPVLGVNDDRVGRFIIVIKAGNDVMRLPLSKGATYEIRSEQIEGVDCSLVVLDSAPRGLAIGESQIETNAIAPCLRRLSP